jgi:hypothetical protein
MNLVASTARASVQDAGSVACTTGRNALAAHGDGRCTGARDKTLGARRGLPPEAARRRRGEARSWGPTAAGNKAQSPPSAGRPERIPGLPRWRPASRPGMAAGRGTLRGSGTNRRRGLGLAAPASLSPRRPASLWARESPIGCSLVPRVHPGCLQSDHVRRRTDARDRRWQGARAAGPARDAAARQGTPPGGLAGPFVCCGGYGQDGGA